MKYLTIILSFYILTLSFVTCTDVVCDNFIETDIEHVAEDDTSTEHSHSEESDTCSPFCSCQCCQLTVDVFPFPAYILISEEDTVDVISSYQNEILQGVLNSLYQPPIV